MGLICSQCGSNIDGDSVFCPYCGELAPQKTILFSEETYKINDPKYCPECGIKNNEDSLFCSKCGKKLHSRPTLENFFCGKCGEKNKRSANICCNCGIDFNNWFAMKGEIAEKLGFKGDLILTEKMNDITYKFVSKEKFNIGRRRQNDLAIPCSWVSGNHCHINLESKTFIDSSTNGTFVNRKPDHIKNEPLELVNEFNIADSFTFFCVKRENLFGFRLGAIQNEEDCRRNGDGNAFDKLRKVYVFLYWGDFELIIQKIDGFVPEKEKPGVPFYKIKHENGFFYYSDKDREIDSNLVLKENSNLPKNWIIKKGD